MKIVISEFMDQPALSLFPNDYTVVFDPHLVDRPQDLKDMLIDADALLVRNRTQVDAALLASAPKLKTVGRLGVGLDNIDLVAARQRGISVLPATGANANAVAEYVMGNLFVLLRGAYLKSSVYSAMCAGKWPRQQLVGAEMSGKTLGLVGLGDIARTVARKAAAMGMDIMAFDPYVPAEDPAWQWAKKVDFETLFTRSDAISLHVPLMPSTRHLIDKTAIDLMHPKAILINTSRGGVVDEQALSEALRAGKIGGAALDVFETEPLSKANAEMFSNLDNILLTPHIAGVTHEANTRVSVLSVKNILHALKNER